jgi:small subunit ribosomal protein S9
MRKKVEIASTQLGVENERPSNTAGWASTSTMNVAWFSRQIREGLRCTSSPLPIFSRPPLRRQVLNPPPRRLSTSSRLHASIAAPEIDFDNLKGKGDEEEAHVVRLLPESPSYFTAQPGFTDHLLEVQYLLQKYSTLPLAKPGEVHRIAWRNLLEYRNTLAENVRSSKHRKLINILNRLNQIHPSLMPAEVIAAMNHHRRVINPYQNNPKPGFIDPAGKALGVGRRKACTARAWVVEGTGEVLVNGKTLAESFGRIHDRESAIWALKSTDRIDKYNVWALVSGGGTTGQAEAITLAVAKALLVHEPALKPALRRGKLQVPVLLSMSHDRFGIFVMITRLKNGTDMVNLQLAVLLEI